jgi:hypothetical protein
MTTKTRSVVYTKFSDEEHSWIEVPLLDVVRMGIDRFVSPYSYNDEKRGLVYLENFKDSGYLLEKADIEEVDLKIVASDRNPEFIRALAPYHPPKLFWRTKS